MRNTVHQYLAILLFDLWVIESGSTVTARKGCLPAARCLRLLVQRGGHRTSAKRSGLPSAYCACTGECARSPAACGESRQRLRVGSVGVMRGYCPRSQLQSNREMFMCL